MTRNTDKNLAWVLASANEMIEESVYHCETFSHTLKAHHNEDAALVFDMAQTRFEAEQLLVLESLKGVELPKIPPWEIPHQNYEHPATLLVHADYLMTLSEAWKMIHDMIQVHLNFYHHLLETTQETEVKDFIRQLHSHCQKCEQASHQAYQQHQSEKQEDLDPPNIQG